jgi:hypothetical protein
VISTGDDIDTGGEKFLADLFRDPEPAGGIFAVGNHEIEAEALAQFRNLPDHRNPARTTNDISTEKNSHQTYSTMPTPRESLRPR